MDALSQIDARLFLWINGAGKNGFFDALMPLVTQFRLFLVPLAAAWIWLFWNADRRTRVLLVLVLAAVGLSDLTVSHLLKSLVGRVRPCHVLPANLFFSCKHSSSMPSSHAANLACAAVLLGARYRAWIPALVLGVIVVGYSRVYVGLHYPGDVLVGYLVGAAIGGIAVAVWRRAAASLEGRAGIRNTD
jgi:undecaprenyl-diphosphatase